jgi:hypothetical protein
VYSFVVRHWCWVGLLLDLAARGAIVLMLVFLFGDFMNKLFAIPSLMIALFFSVANSAMGTTLSVFEAMNIITMLEASTSALTTLSDVKNSTDFNASWDGTFSNSGWTYSLLGNFDGNPLNLNYVGTLNGDFGENIVVSFTGNGNLGSEPLNIGGQMTWLYDSTLDDYLEMDFEQLTKIGENSLWGWVVGAEIGLGVATGVAVGIGVGTIIAPAGVVAGIKAGAEATGIFIVISNKCETREK